MEDVNHFILCEVADLTKMCAGHISQHLSEDMQEELRIDCGYRHMYRVAWNTSQIRINSK